MQVMTFEEKFTAFIQALNAIEQSLKSDFYKLAGRKQDVLKIGFDSCSISGVIKYLDVNSNF